MQVLAKLADADRPHRAERGHVPGDDEDFQSCTLKVYSGIRLRPTQLT
jgi:hypothetical protein